ncbi:nucleotidyl transferase AbiEii/AbiGii toxin family protein [Thalassoporum mexicanum]|nr:nucleotidyl transferase AbiEii/AbiGii toxin family protein [Pseudanabaena sp. PCC 7367]
MLQILPHIHQEDTLALKGGTAINLFERDMPRLSVDIDLTYLPFDDRGSALANITAVLNRIQQRLTSSIPGIQIRKLASDGQEAKMVCQLSHASVKVEINTVIRGHLWPPRLLQLSDAAQEQFGKFAAMQVVSQAELYGGKICAGLDRQHPRDIFDIHQLYQQDGLSEEIRQGLIVSLLSHPRPIHEILAPNLKDQQTIFNNQFTGMTDRPFTYADFEATREKLAQDIRIGITDNYQNLLLSFTNAEPDWTLFPLARLQELPAVRWKLSNIQKLRAQNPRKHTAQLKALEKALSFQTP